MTTPINPKLNKWLQKKIKDPYVQHIYSKSLLPNTYSGRYDKESFYEYYSDNDIDVQNTDVLSEFTQYMIDNDPSNIDRDTQKLVDVLEIYDDKTILLPPNCNQSHANYLFKLLLDESCNMICNVPMISSTGVIQMKEMPMIDTAFKNKFYNFCCCCNSS